jgi:dTDP-4-amino-4,6-dideoxygalactose transaminase
MAVHFGGLAIDVSLLRAALPAHVVIIEDAAHAFGASYPDGKPVGASGNPVCFSFYANKNLSTAEGGAIALNDPDAAARLRSLRQHGLPANAWMRFTHPQEMPRHELIELGFKMNYTDLQAALGRVQLSRQNLFQNRRLAIAKTYAKGLASANVRLQTHCLDAIHARHLFTIQLPLESISCSRDEFVLALRQRNIGASIHYAPLHQMEFYRPYSNDFLPVTEDVANRILTLPISASMTVSDAAGVIAHCLELLKF